MEFAYRMLQTVRYKYYYTRVREDCHRNMDQVFAKEYALVFL